MNPKNDAYWEQKMRIFIHDPMDKALRIPGHENRAGQMADAFGISTPDKSEVSQFDMMAAGLDRAALPGYSTHAAQNGAVDFAEHPTITHPIAGGALTFSGKLLSAKETTDQLSALIKEDTNDTTQRWDKRTTFNYLFFVLRKRLISKNCGDLGFLWDKLPADSRIPDHSIWNHNGMTSALYSCFTESQTNAASMVVFSLSPVQPFIGKTRKLRDHWVGSVILSWLTFEGICAIMEQLGPDHLLYPSLQDQPLMEQYLIEEINHNFAPFFHEYRDDLKKWCGMQQDESVASFPNKFVFLAPAGQEAELTQAIETRIHKKWLEIGDTTLNWLKEGEDEELKTIFRRQTENFWQFSWSSAHLVQLKHKGEIETLFDPEKFKDLFETVEKFSKVFANSTFETTQQYAYPITHSLVQTVMAVGKNAPTTTRRPEPGIKCPVCGEFEILHGMTKDKNPALNDDNIRDDKGRDDETMGRTVQPHEYKRLSKQFWKHIAESKHMEGSIIKEDEQLCSICAIKRFAPHVLDIYEKCHGKAHPLKPILKEGAFPSTTEMATFEFREKLKSAGLLDDKALEKDMIDELHEQPESNDPGEGSSGIRSTVRQTAVRQLLSKAKQQQNPIILSDEDSYYAILMMDGDKMGNLVNGTTIAATWKDVLHPELVARYRSGTLKTKWKDIWKDSLPKQRILSPALHATLSESLGAFALYAVPDIIRRCHGKLVYAGGDDVAAVLPLSTALDAARQIQQAYNMRFATSSDGGIVPLTDQTDGKSPVLLLPGEADPSMPDKKRRISISGAILLCHHKQPLRGALETAHHILDTVAKKRKGRNAIAVRLKKRSGHERDFAAKWHAINPFHPEACPIVDSFLAVQEAYGNKTLSGSLIYRFSELAVMVDSVLQGHGPNLQNAKSAIQQLIRIFAYEISHSGTFNPKGGDGKPLPKEEKEILARTLAAHIAGITIHWDKTATTDKAIEKIKGKWIYDGEVPVIARYLSRGGAAS